MPFFIIAILVDKFFDYISNIDLLKV